MMAAASRSRLRKRTIPCSPRSDRGFDVAESSGGGPLGLPPEGVYGHRRGAPRHITGPAGDDGFGGGSLEAHGVNVKNVPAARSGEAGEP